LGRTGNVMEEGLCDPLGSQCRRQGEMVSSSNLICDFFLGKRRTNGRGEERGRLNDSLGGRSLPRKSERPTLAPNIVRNQITRLGRLNKRKEERKLGGGYYENSLLGVKKARQKVWKKTANVLHFNEEKKKNWVPKDQREGIFGGIAWGGGVRKGTNSEDSRRKTRNTAPWV